MYTAVLKEGAKINREYKKPGEKVKVTQSQLKQLEATGAIRSSWENKNIPKIEIASNTNDPRNSEPEKIEVNNEPEKPKKKGRKSKKDKEAEAAKKAEAANGNEDPEADKGNENPAANEGNINAQE